MKEYRYAGRRAMFDSGYKGLKGVMKEAIIIDATRFEGNQLFFRAESVDGTSRFTRASYGEGRFWYLL